MEKYLKEYTYSFKEKPFNEVDNLIFSTIIYLDFSKILEKGKISLTRLADLYLTLCPKLPKNSPFAYKDAFKMMKLIKDNPRYDEVLVYNYVYDISDDYQFGALTFEFLNNIYVAFEGTDDNISGWEEDFKMSYMFPVPAQKKAIKYLKRYTFGNQNIYLGGHSKGGNLALVSAMYSNIFIRSRIIKIYSNDGPGLNDKFSSYRYRRISKKVIHLIPQNSVVGLLYGHKDDVVIRSKAPILFSHAPLSWKVEDSSFERDELNKFSLAFDKGLSDWMNLYNCEEKEEFVTEAFDILRKHNIKTLTEIKSDFSNVVKILKSSRTISKESKTMLNDLIGIMKNEK